MKDIKLKLKLNKVYERQLLMRRKLWDMEETINAIEKLHKDNYDTIELLIDVVNNNSKKPQSFEINGVMPTRNKVETKGGQWVNKVRYI